MQANENIPWKRITVEAAAIVSSILLAFAIDAWWQGKVEDRREHEVLIALSDSFSQSRANIQKAKDFHLAVQLSNTKLLKAITSEEVTLTNDEIERLVADLGWWDSRSHFSTGALNSLVFGGELSIIQDDVLRQLLADWPSQIAHVDSVRGQDYDFFLNVLMPFLRKNSYLPRMATLGTPMPGQSEVVSALIDLQIDESRSYAEMIAMEEFHNILVQKWWIQFDMLNAIEETESLIDQTIHQIELSQ